MTVLNPTRVHNLIIVDESGSMECIRKQAFTGMNETLQTVRMMQEKYPNQLQYVTLITFDSDHTKLHYDNTPADKTKDMEWKAYNPCAATPLYDAIGKGISKVNAQIEEGDHVLVTIITDGYENSSEEWSLKMVRTLIEKLKKQNWTFTLIGTDNLDVKDIVGIYSYKVKKANKEEVKEIYVDTADVFVYPVKYYFKRKSASEKQSINYPCQGTGAVMFKTASIFLWNYLLNHNLIFKVKLCVPAHDEWNIEVPEEMAEEMTNVLQDCMSKAGEFFCRKLPMPADATCSDHWVH